MTSGSSFTMEAQTLTGADSASSGLTIGHVTLKNSTLTIKASEMTEMGTVIIGDMSLTDCELVIGPFTLHQGSLTVQGLALDGESMEIRDVSVTGKSAVLDF